MSKMEQFKVNGWYRGNYIIMHNVHPVNATTEHCWKVRNTTLLSFLKNMIIKLVVSFRAAISQIHR